LSPSNTSPESSLQLLSHCGEHRLQVFALPFYLFPPGRIVRNTRLLVRILTAVIIQRLEQAIGITDLLSDSIFELP
jgi:hypothetical protein